MADTCVKPTFVEDQPVAHIIVLAASTLACDANDDGDVGLYYDDTGYYDDTFNFVE